MVIIYLTNMHTLFHWTHEELDQFSPVVRRLERLRFATLPGRASVALHTRLIDLCAEGDTEAAADVSHETWQSLQPLLDTLT